ncbi:SUPPRESSOR OF MAX2 1-like protein [Drosera capensis]
MCLRIRSRISNHKNCRRNGPIIVCVFIRVSTTDLTTNGVPDNCQYLSLGLRLNDDKLASLAIGGWQLRLLVGDKAAKRSLDSQQDEEVRVTQKLKKLSHGLWFDLNQMADLEDERLEGSRNSSDLIFELEGEHGHEHKRLTISHDLLESVDDTIFFKPVDFAPIRSNIEIQITSKFSTIVGNKVLLKVEQEALEKILGGIWLGEVGLQPWLVKGFVPSIQRLEANLLSSSDQTLVARLELYSNSESRSHGDWLPSRITVVFDGQ